MVVEIKLDNTRLVGEGDRGFLNLQDEDKDEDYASWPFYSKHYEGSKMEPHWTWENPDEDLENITLSPSLILEWDDPNTFHIFIKNGEVEHCSDCQCGC